MCRTLDPRRVEDQTETLEDLAQNEKSLTALHGSEPCVDI